MSVLRRPHDHHRDLRARLPAHTSSPSRCRSDQDRHFMMPRSNACNDTRVLTSPSQLASPLTSNPPDSSAVPLPLSPCDLRFALIRPPIPAQSLKTISDDDIPQY